MTLLFPYYLSLSSSTYPFSLIFAFTPMKKENKLQKTLKGLMAIVRNPWLLNHVLSDNSVWAQHIEKKYGIRNGLKTVDITTLFPGFRENIDTFAFLDGGSSALDLSVIRGLCKTIPNCTYF